MKVIHLLLLAGAIVAGAAFAEPYGDRVARCLAEQKVMPDSPDFNQQAERCERILRMDDAKAAWQVCMWRAVASMDDRVSPASDIATATADQCGQEYGAMLDASTLSPESPAETADGVRPAGIVAGCPAAGTVRAGRQAW